MPDPMPDLEAIANAVAEALAVRFPKCKLIKGGPYKLGYRSFRQRHMDITHHLTTSDIVADFCSSVPPLRKTGTLLCPQIGTVGVTAVSGGVSVRVVQFYVSQSDSYIRRLDILYA